MEIVYVYTKTRREFGRHPNFTTQDPSVLADLPPNASQQEKYMVRPTTNTSVQCVQEKSESEVNTEIFETATRGMLHTEGGWPKDVDVTEMEQKIRFRKKVEKDEDYIRTIASCATASEHYIRQNNAIDIYEEYFTGQYVDHSSEPPSAKTLTVFRDPNPVKRTATHISWYPPDGSKLLVSYAILQFQQMPEGMSLSSYIWDVNNPNYPDMEICPSSPLCCVEYNPKDSHLIAGGSYNGLISYWDTRKGSLPIDSSLIEKSHRDPVYDLKWLQSKTGTECMTVSTDGQVLFWDIRKLGEPIEIMPIQPKGQNAGGPLGGVSLDYNPQVGGPSKFMVGTEQGVILSCNRKAKTPADRVGNAYPGHHGPIYALHRNPHFPKYFMSIGDWTARIWMEDIRTPIMTTKYHMSYLTDGAWSPTRPGVFYTCKMDGSIDVWDYLYKQNAPVLSVQVADVGLQSLKAHEHGKLVAVGAVDGSTSLLELSDGLCVMQSQEKQSISQMLERETKREKNLDIRAKEAKQKQRAAEANRDDEDQIPDEVKKELKAVEEEFMDAIGNHAGGAEEHVNINAGEDNDYEGEGDDFEADSGDED